jgi:hypothetical protein
VIGPTTAKLLDAWERSTGLSHAAKAQVLGDCMSAPDMPGGVADVPIGVRDAWLLRLRGSIFGRRLGSMATCPSCSVAVEFDLDAEELADGADSLGRAFLSEGPWSIEFRVPTTADLIEVEQSGGDAARLLSRCVVEASEDGRPVSTADLPPDVGRALERRIAELDPMADIRLDLHCAACAHTWSASFDIVSFLDSELDAWAHGLMSEVTALARAFGWSEPEVLALSDARRRTYLELARA